MLQARALANMRLAFGSDAPLEAAQLYFRRIAWWLSNALAVFHHGVDASPVAEDLTFDSTFAVVDEAMALGRGVPPGSFAGNARAEPLVEQLTFKHRRAIARFVAGPSLEPVQPSEVAPRWGRATARQPSAADPCLDR
jgi:hypothetical protein